MRKIDVLLFDGVNLLDVSGPVQAFASAHGHYRHRFVTRDGKAVRAGCRMQITPDAALAPSDADLLIPGGAVDPLLSDEALMAQVRARAAGQGRLISICSGALILAQAGLLDGRTATTHWSREAQLARYPQVNWDLDGIYAEDGKIYTSAGVTTGIDLALAIIRSDLGREVALAVARELVVQLRRTGGQSQYAIHLAGQISDDDSLAGVIEAVVAHPDRDWTLETLAGEAGLNPRTLARRFRRDMDLSPAQFVERTRLDHARGLLSANLPLKSVAVQAGFGDLQRMRRAFQKRFGVGAADYARLFRDDAASSIPAQSGPYGQHVER
ncbi:transcriptional regulator GlxA family with amidase domain [Litoreibacter ponti]|uniref:Transcriptional regulator GlxA family with amidase domain n=1 Tax=Litoreibacter ponti TaxID=1510457 RepID=A0A2T6BHN6_9RHOB|nr:DJ-1/PfpI family protein [Litoreibacter ponti]PTX55569.1 transcriptional regulator GlxA family with amidase domain [Litoreibacter ponti]